MRYLISFMLTVMIGLTPAQAFPTPITLWFAGDQTAVADRLAAICQAIHGRVEQRTDHYLLCQRPASIADRMALQHSGSPYAGSAQTTVTFWLQPDRGTTKVETRQFVASYSGPSSDFPAKVRRAMTDLLQAAGGEPIRPAKPVG